MNCCTFPYFFSICIWIVLIFLSDLKHIFNNFLLFKSKWCRISVRKFVKCFCLNSYTLMWWSQIFSLIEQVLNPLFLGDVSLTLTWASAQRYLNDLYLIISWILLCFLVALKFHLAFFFRTFNVWSLWGELSLPHNLWIIKVCVYLETFLRDIFLLHKVSVLILDWD